MNDNTASNLRSAFGGESMAHMRYKVWAATAAKGGFVNVARLFRAISRAEEAHASGHFNTMRDEAGGFDVKAGGGFGIGSTSENLAGAIEGELYEVNTMYPEFIAQAETVGENPAIRSMNYALAAERIHAEMYQNAKDAVDGGDDVKLGTIHICPVCGHTLEGDLPDACPVCNMAKADQFVTFSA